MRFFFVSVVSYAVFALLWPFLLTHPKMRAGLWQRLALYPALPRTPLRARIWLHGASAGDVLAQLRREIAAEEKRQHSVLR